MQNFIKCKCILTKNDDNYAVAPCDLMVALPTHLPNHFHIADQTPSVGAITVQVCWNTQ